MTDLQTTKNTNPLKIRNSTAEFLMFTADSRQDGIEVRFQDETIWLTQKLIAKLFEVTVPTINERIKTIFTTEELDQNSVVRNFLITASDGKNYKTKHYNLDAIIAVGYRINSKRATQFRQWATRILSEKRAVKNSPLQRGGSEADGVFHRFKKYSQLPYNPKLKEKAKQLRKGGNLSEVLFWNKVKRGQLLNLDFERQKIIGNYIVDFYCGEIDLVVEIDGESHDFKGEYDNIRDNYLRSLDLQVLHVEDIRVKKDLDNLMDEVYKLCYELKQKTPRQASPATPSDTYVVRETRTVPVP